MKKGSQSCLLRIIAPTKNMICFNVILKLCMILNVFYIFMQINSKEFR